MISTTASKPYACLIRHSGRCSSLPLASLSEHSHFRTSELNASKIRSEASRACRPMTYFPVASTCRVVEVVDAFPSGVELKRKAVTRWQASHIMKTKLLGYLLQIQAPACYTGSALFCASRRSSYIICVGPSALPRNAIFLRCLQNNGSYM